MSDTYKTGLCSPAGNRSAFSTFVHSFESRLHYSICVQSASLLRAELIFLQDNEMKLHDV